MSNIGSRIRELRKSEHLTQKDFSSRLLVSQSYLSGVENGNEIPTSKLIKLICHEFGVNEEWLTTDQGEMYGAVYENDRSALADVSNSALLKIMESLNTKSNVQYGHFAFSLAAIADVLSVSSFLKEDERLQYLAAVENFAVELQRAVLVLISEKKRTAEAQRQCEEVGSALASLLDLLSNLFQ